MNIKIGGGDEILAIRAPLCGAFYSAGVYPLSLETNSWSNKVIPIQWITKIPQELISTTLGNIEKVLFYYYYYLFYYYYYFLILKFIIMIID